MRGVIVCVCVRVCCLHACAFLSWTDSRTDQRKCRMGGGGVAVCDNGTGGRVGPPAAG